MNASCCSTVAAKPADTDKKAQSQAQETAATPVAACCTDDASCCPDGSCCDDEADESCC